MAAALEAHSAAGIAVYPPDSFAVQFVFRQQCNRPLPVELRSNWTHVWIDGAVKALRHMSDLRSAFGTAGAGKAIAKLVSGRRKLLLIKDAGKIVFHAWTKASKCKYYYVEPNAVVIGPIWTDENSRGQGLATNGVKAVINSLIKAGHNTFYIDTRTDNHSCLRAIDKCGFGPAISLFCRPHGGTL